MAIRIGVDVGSGYTKFANAESGSPRYAFPSIVANVTDKSRMRGLGSSDPSIVEFGSASYVVGEDAHLLGGAQQRLNTLSDEYALTDQWLALFYSALANCVPDSENDVQVCVALPQAIYYSGSIANNLMDRLNKKNTSFTYKGVVREFSVSAIVAPQAGAIALDCALKGLGREPDVEIGVIDIGTYTTGLAVMLNHRLYHDGCSGITEGVAKIATNLGERLSQKFGVEFHMPKDLLTLHKALHKGSVKILGESKDISLYIHDSSADVAQSIIKEAHRTWPRPKTMEIYIAGGGAPFVEPHIRNEFPHAVMVDDPFWSVLNGLAVYANKSFQS